MRLPPPPTADEVLARIPSMQSKRRLYAPSGGAAIDPATVALAIEEAWSEAHSLTQEAFPNGLRNADGTIDPFLLGAVVDLANAIAAGRHLAANDASGYFKAAERARKVLRELKSDSGRRRTEGQGEPTASVVAAITPDPGATLWNDAANGKTWSPY